MNETLEGLRKTQQFRDGHNVRVAERCAAERGLETYIDAHGLITLIDPTTGAIEHKRLTADQVIALYCAKSWREQ